MELKRQIALLLNYLPDTDGQPYSANDLAHRMGVSPQAVLNLLEGNSANPRLDTLRQLCNVLGISLDYFGLLDEQDCIEYLKVKRVARSTPTIQAIHLQSSNLSRRATANVLVMLSWAEIAARPSRREDNRKYQ
jgi:transcriptional regulator with XRE-family HTH domain